MVGGHVMGAVKAVATMVEPSGVLPTSTLCPKISEPSSAAAPEGCFCANVSIQGVSRFRGKLECEIPSPQPESHVFEPLVPSGVAVLGSC